VRSNLTNAVTHVTKLFLRRRSAWIIWRF